MNRKCVNYAGILFSKFYDSFDKLGLYPVFEFDGPKLILHMYELIGSSLEYNHYKWGKPVEVVFDESPDFTLNQVEQYEKACYEIEKTLYYLEHEIKGDAK